MSKENRAKYLFKNSLIFTIGSFASKFISFFLVPLYTNILSTSEYGIVDLISTICTIAIPIITLNVMESVMRFNLDKEEDKNVITKTGIVVLFGGFILGLLLIPICMSWDEVKDYCILIYLFVVCTASSQVFLCDLRGKELLLFYSIGNILNTFLIAFLNILFLVFFKWRIKGYLLAYIIASLSVAIYALIVGKGYKAIRTKINKGKMIEMLKYSIVLIPNSFMWWIMNSSDHIMVVGMMGVAANGIYAVSYKLPTLITSVMSIFNQAWSYSAIREEDSDDADAYTNRVFYSMRGIVFMIGICMLIVMKPFLKMYVSRDYYESWKYSPFLVIGCVYLAMATFMSTSYTVHKDSKGFLISGTLGAVLNITMNFILIPCLGVYGAAIATCISYISVFIFRIIHTKKYTAYKVIDKEFFWGTFGLFANSLLMYFEGGFFFVLQIIVALVVVFSLRNIWLPFIKIVMNKSSKGELL